MHFFGMTCLAVLYVANTVLAGVLIVIASMGFWGDLIDGSHGQNVMISLLAILLALPSVFNLFSMNTIETESHGRSAASVIGANAFACVAWAIFFRGSAIEYWGLLLFYATNAIGVGFLTMSNCENSRSLVRPARRGTPEGDSRSELDDVESVVRMVLHRELRLSNLDANDDLIELDPEFPTEEVFKDVLEEYGVRRHEPTVSDWTGTFADLVRVVRREIELT